MQITCYIIWSKYISHMKCSISRASRQMKPWNLHLELLKCFPVNHFGRKSFQNISHPPALCYGLPLGLSGKDFFACSSGAAGDLGLIPGLGRSPGGGHGKHSNVLAWRIPMDRGAWWATVDRVAKSQRWLKWERACARTLCYGVFRIQFSYSLVTQGPCFESEWLPCPGTQAWPQSGRWRSWPFSHPPSCPSPLLSLLRPSIHTSTITLTTWRPKYLSIQVFGLRPPCSGQGPGFQ